MMKSLIVKEFYDLIRDPRIWIPFIISALMLPVMGLVTIIPMKSAITTVTQGSVNVGILNFDNGSESITMVNFLKSLRNSGISSVLINISYDANLLSNYSLLTSKLLGHIRQENLTYLDLIVVLFPNFSIKVKNREQVSILTINLIHDVGFFGINSLKGLSVLEILKNYLVGRYLNGTGIPLAVISNPINSLSVSYLEQKNVVIYGNPSFVISSLSSAALFVPIIMMIVSVGVMQMSATSMAIENEEKTLETLLTFPVSRFTILLSKLLGSFIVSLLGSSFSIFGFVLYLLIFSSFSESIFSEEPFTFQFPNFSNLIVSPMSVVLIIVSIVIMLFFMASLGIVIGALSSDTRLAGTISGPISMLVFVPGYFIVFADITRLHPILKFILFSLPFTQPIAFAKVSIISSMPSLIETIVYLSMALFISLILIFVTAKIFSVETLSNIRFLFKRKIKS